jgi:hypothetical protein
MELILALDDRNTSFVIEDKDIIQLIKSSEDPLQQLKALLHNGFIMTKCIAPSTITCSCCPEINKLKDTLFPITELFNTGGNSSKNGKLCEVIMGDLFKKTFPGLEYEDTSGSDRNGDAIVTISNLKIMIDYKNYTQLVPTTEIDKLVRDLKVRDVPMGILYSTNTRIAKKDTIDYDIIDGKLIVYMTGEGLSVNGLMIAIKFILHLHQSNVVSISDKVCELVNKNIGRNLQTMYTKLIEVKDALYRHNERIDASTDKINKMMNALKDDGVHMISKMMDIVEEIREIIEETSREPSIITSPYEDLVDFIHRSTDKKKDITQCLQVLSITSELGIQCGCSDRNCIVFFRGEVEIGKLKITKTNAILVFYNLVKKGCVSFDCDYEEVKHGDFHIVLTESIEKWTVIKGRFSK